MIIIEKENVQLRVEEKDLNKYLKEGYKKYKKEEEKQIKSEKSEKVEETEKVEKLEKKK